MKPLPSRLAAHGRRTGALIAGWRPWQASLPRALAETVIACLPLFVALMAAQALMTGVPLLPGIYVFCGVAGLYLAARLRLPTGSLWRQAAWECLVTAALVLALVLVYGPLLAAAESAGWLPAQPGSLLTTAVLCLAGVAYLGLRVLARMWLVWDRLRRKQLVFAITHVYLTITLAATCPFVLAAAVLVGASGFSKVVLTPASLPATVAVVLFIGIVPVFALFMLLTLGGVIFLIPPFALISYLAARRVTGRLLSLDRAAEAMRRGDYSVRVPVSGEDEVARLQGNFNGMAAHLQQALAELQAERDRVTGLLDARRELIANVSHELRTPVATVRAYLDSAIEAQQAPSAEQMQHDLRVMEAEVIRLQGLIEELFELSRNEVSPLTLRLAPTDVVAAVRGAVEAMAPLAWRTGSVQMVADLPASLPPALADASRLHQVLANLLRNAVRHTPPGGIVAAAAKLQDGAVAITVRDTGAGIAPEDLPHVWERFYQGPDGDGSGAGLGLALVQEMVAGMRGTVAVESTPGEGCCFTVKLPTNATMLRQPGDTPVTPGP